MDDPHLRSRMVRIGPFEADLRAGELWRDGRKIPLQEKPFRVLMRLAERPGEAVTRDELRRHLWAEETFVDFDHGLNTAVRKLRQALEDSADSPRYVETLAKRGYRLIAAPSGPPPAEASPSREETAATDGRAPAIKRVVLSLAAVLTVAVLAWLGVRSRGPRDPGLIGPSIAIVPFANLSQDPADAYLADGLTQTLTTELARIAGLRVIAWKSAFRYRDEGQDARRVGSELGVGYVLLGSVQRADRLRVNTHLVDVATGAHVWAERYDREPSAVLLLQDDIARGVRRALRARVATLRDQGPEEPSEARPEAYDAYLRALHLAAQIAEADRNRSPDPAVTILEQAVDLDPGFALAHASLAQAYADRFFYFDASPDWRAKGLDEAGKALALEPRLAEAYVARADLEWTRANRFPHEQALADIRRALDLKPNLVGARWSAARLFTHLGLFDRALAEIEEARRVDPKDLDLVERRGIVQALQRNYSGALESFQGAGGCPDQIQRIVAMAGLGRSEAARRDLREFLRRNPVEPDGFAYHAVMLARAGDRGEARREIARAREMDRGHSHFHHAQYFVGAAHALLGERDPALEWLERSADEGFPCYPCFAGDPDLESLNGDPRFQDLLLRLKTQWERYRSVL